MAIGRTVSVALNGLAGAVVEVEASAGPGLPGLRLIGLPDAALSEAEHRIRAAASNSGCSLSQNSIVANLSPASLPKHGSGFDLAIAMASLAATGVVRRRSVAAVAHLGELGLDGRLRPVLGVLPAVRAAARSGIERVMVPTANAAEAALVPGIDVVPVTSLREAAIRHGADLEPIEVEPVRGSVQGGGGRPVPDLSDVIGNAHAIEALITAAAGGHHVFFLGPPGAGKTMLAERLPGLLPDLDDEQALEATSIRSLYELGSLTSLVRRPPFEAPHHTASAAALVGGGSGRIRPGAAVRATHGVLFLDEAPEFHASALDALRQPLESGTVSIARASGTADFPAKFLLVLAANPCPCGHFGEPDAECTCRPDARRRYLARLSGPLLDRVDIQLQVPRLTAAQLRRAQGEQGTTTAEARAKVVAAREAAAERFRGMPWRRNADAPASWLTSPRTRPSRAALAPLEQALDRGVLTMRGYHRALRLAWTLSDLEGRSEPDADLVGKAIAMRQGLA